MSETGKRLRSLFEEIAPPIEMGAIMAAPEAQPRRRGWLIAAAAAAFTLVVGVAGWLLVALRDGGPVTSGPGPSATSPTTTVTTTTSATSLPTQGSLDALGAYAAGPVPAPATCPPGSTPDVPGDPQGPRPPTSGDDLGVAAFDRQSGLLVFRGSTWTWVFDPCRNRWEERAAGGPTLGPSAYLSMAYDEDDDLIVAFDGDAVWTYDTEADIWSRLPGSLPSTARQARYHSPSGLIVLFEGDTERAWAYDVGTARRFDLGPGLPQRGLVAYDRTGDRWYLYQVSNSGGSNATWRFMPGRGWVGLSVATPSAEFVWSDLYSGDEIAFDEERGRIALLSLGQVAAFDPTVPAWEILYSVTPEAAPTDGPAFRAGAQLAYDSANGRLMMLGGWYGVLGDGGVPAGDLWAYDGPTGEWIELLAAAG